jgi:two-component system cell cycle sensor histidine kinase/response regulator CckA
MSLDNKKKYFFYASILLLFAILTLQYFFEERPHIFFLGIGIGILIILLINFISFKKEFLSYKQFYDQFYEISKEMSKVIELTIFDSNQEAIFSTNHLMYPNVSEFLRKMKIRFGDCNDIQNIKDWIVDNHDGSVVLQDQKTQYKRWWQFDVKAVSNKSLNKGCIVSSKEVTQFLSQTEQLNLDKNNLETFLDTMPFGIMYIDKKRHICGINQTSINWLNQGRLAIIDKRIEEFVDGYEENINQDYSLVKFKPYKASFFNALCFTSKLDSYSISVFCRIDQFNLININKNDDYHNHPAFSESAIPALVIDENGDILSFNNSFNSLFTKLGSNNEIPKVKIGDNLVVFANSSQKDKIVDFLKQILGVENAISPFEFVFADGSLHSTAYISVIRKKIDNNLQHFLLQFIDISEQKRLEQQFIQSQKMQAVGQLAGGIAHDFNNLLTAMIGFCDLLLQRYLPNDPSYMDIVQIKQNANRAANLVKQLLAFSRQQTLQPVVIDITTSLAELSALLRRLIGAGIDFQVIHDRQLWPVKVDAGQFEQVIINLVVNARDAMASIENGKLIISTQNHVFSRAQKVGSELIPKGEYVIIQVEDNGHGIPKDIIDNIFEPFFSTKEIGSGTGLGLSTVYGIVKQTGGFIAVTSTVGKGSNFKIFFPKYKGEEVKKTQSINEENKNYDLTGSENILLVEDEDAVRIFSARTLREKGYNVIDVSSGQEAIELINNGKKFDLMITDVVMPNMDGLSLSKQVHEIDPSLKVIFISGYTEDTFRKNLDTNTKVYFLPKPFTLKDLAEKVKIVLNTN